MRNTLVKNHEQQLRRAKRVRKHLQGTSTRPRLSVIKTNKHIQAQLIDDEKGVTIGMTATFAKNVQGTEFAKKNKTSARKLGEMIAEIAKKQNIKEVIFDRGPFKYHGILAELANGAREAGLQF
jgi:large subunit ribosomal protein L18